MNGAVEAANKNVKKIIAKSTETYKDWHDKFLFALHAYRTGVRTSTGATPYSLVYGIVTPQIRMCDRPEANIHLCLRSLNLLVTY